MNDDVDRLLARLTLEQKASLLSGLDSWRTTPVPDADVPSVWLSDGPHGVRREVAARDSVPSTCFPTESALAATWDRDLVERVGAALGAEARALGVGVLLGPGVNIKRTPLCGRNFEYLSEDPVLTGELAAAYVTGVQSRGVGTSLKHFAANNQEWGRHWYSSDVDERTLREIYLAAFERVVTRARPWTVMCSYNRLNGVHASQHGWLLDDLLRGEWGYDGLVVSDWGAVHDRVAALAAGLDLEMPGCDGVTDAKVVAAVRDGRISEEVLDRSVRRVLELVARAVPAPMTRLIRWGVDPETPGLDGRTVAGGPEGAAGAGPAVGDQPADGEPADGPGALPEDMVAAHHALAAEAAQAAITLLRNDGVLPLTAPRRLAVVGRLAVAPRIQGAGSALVNPARTPVSVLDALRSSFDVTYAEGYAMTAEAPDAAREAEALAAVRAADVALVLVGQVDGTESEGYDRAHLDLPAAQEKLLDAAVASGTPVVAIVNGGSAVRLGGWRDRAAAVVHCPFLGQAGGEALARVLAGDVDPSGRLAETWPVRLEDTPAFVTYPGDRGHARYGEGVFVGYRWYDELGLAVGYPFGHGLSYTRFEYRDAAAGVVDAEAGVVEVACEVVNVGERPGVEVVQVYVAPPRRRGGVPVLDGEPGEAVPVTPVRRPVRELRDFARVSLAPGGTARVVVTLEPRAFAYWDVAGGLWRRDAGSYVVELGSSSRDLRAAVEVTLPASPADRPEPTDVELRDAVVARSAVVS
ncbi:beta-glucosidase [Salana multivorans]|uniref:Beta-glucosidase n=1 Tax=Salana multivorans TaxID=120377 RepID=A0A3N2DAR1_9MICO|nr:glycoside hydrolase family 3 C-terminal domain-containing protein [Salana multivorans]ROR96895.1 beta-glucosidase [Salana multivorans]